MKMTAEKWADGMAQVVEHLSSKLKALSSNPSTTKIKNKQNCFKIFF
jgi:hypothetical protein